MRFQGFSYEKELKTYLCLVGNKGIYSIGIIIMGITFPYSLLRTNKTTAS